MVLTSGQTYFFILCQTVFAIVVCRAIYNLMRIRMISGGHTCKALEALKRDVSDARRLALIAYNKAAKRVEDK